MLIKKETEFIRVNSEWCVNKKCFNSLISPMCAGGNDMADSYNNEVVVCLVLHN
jgi:hypothetical protein